MIEVKNLTLKYSGGKGVFDLDFTVERGEVAGYLGPNGAGKTTTIRALMGFMSPNSGGCSIGGLSCFENAPRIMKTLGYIPGEIAFIEGMNGGEYLDFIARTRGIRDKSRRNELADMFEFSSKGAIRKFSKGTKQKLGIIAAFMSDPEVLILDEPSSGLDPLMQSRFVELILAEKKKGRTILLSSHIFEEVERTCDNVLIIKDGRIAARSDVSTMKASQRKAFVVRTPETEKAVGVFVQSGFTLGEVNGERLEVYVTGEAIDKFAKSLSHFTLSGLEAKTQTLEDVFMHYYRDERKGSAI